MYTANTMASAIEACGMALPFNASNPAVSKDKKDECKVLGEYLKNLIEKEYIENKKQSIGLIQIVFFKVGLFIIRHVFIRMML